jgi:transcriptional regulator with XRE-family HTH domain
MNKRYLFTNQVSNKLKSLDLLPEWLVNYPDFSDQIKMIRETLGMTQFQLARKVNRSLRTIQLIESGEVWPKISTLKEIAKALNTELTIALIPQQNIVKFLNEKAMNKASQMVKMNKASATLENQTPSKRDEKEQTLRLKNEILERRRDILWDQKRSEK